MSISAFTSGIIGFGSAAIHGIYRLIGRDEKPKIELVALPILRKSSLKKPGEASSNKSVQFQFPSSTFTAQEIKNCIFAPLKSGSFRIKGEEFDNLEAAYRHACLTTRSFSKREIMTELVYFWFALKRGVTHIPELAHWDLLAQVQHPEIENFGNLVIEQRIEFRLRDRFVNKIKREILGKEMFEGKTVEEKYHELKTDDLVKNETILRCLLRVWIEEHYAGDPYKALPLFMNACLIRKVKTKDFPHLGRMFLEERGKFRP